ncbi:MAG: heme exporter protein CcmD [Gammaproteobacteria bacterium]
MTAIADFFAMDGYGVYVWPAYLAAAVVVAVLWRAAAVRKARALRRLRCLYGGGKL